MGVVSETQQETIARPVSSSRAFKRSWFGRILLRSPFYFLVIIIFIYALFPFLWALRSAFTFSTRIVVPPTPLMVRELSSIMRSVDSAFTRTSTE